MLKIENRMKVVKNIQRAIIAAVVLMLAVLSSPVSGQEVYSSSSSYASYFIDAGGRLYTWGEDEYQHPVVATMTAQDLAPIMVALPGGVTSWLSVAAGHIHSLAIGNDGNVYAWGSNGFGQLGNGTTTDSNLPVKVELPNGVTAKAVACGYYHSLALGNDGNIYAWGENNNGQLGNGTTVNSDIPVKATLPSGFTPAEIFAGWYYSFALGADGSLYAWGGNLQGQLGLGNTTNQSLPVEVPFPSGVTKWTGAYGGIYFTAATGNDGNLYETGYNQYGQLGNGTATGTSSGTTTFEKANMPSGVTGWKAIACAGSSVLTIGGNDTLYAWGYGGSGEMGNGTGGSAAASNPVPVKVILPTGVLATSVAAGRNHGLVVGSDGYLYAWGQGTQGQLGNGGISNSYSPVMVQMGSGASSPVKLLTVNPGETDPSIETVHGPSIAVYDTDVSSQNKLILFLVGTGGSATASWAMDSIYATMGFHAITLDYEDNVVAASLADSTDSTAFGRYREEIVTGAPVSNSVDVDTANSILNRFQKLLVYLVSHDPNGGWGEYVSNNEPVWSRIIVAGHSQGSGHAAYIGKLFDVNRVLMFSGPQDYMDILNAPAPWQSVKGATSPSRYFAFLHQQDPYNVNHQIANCMALMDTQRPATLTGVLPGDTIQGNWRILVTDIPTSSPHGSTILPIFQNVWQFMLTAGLPIAPPVPVLVAPHGTSNVPRRAKITWDSATAATAYRLQIATDTAFTSIIVDTTVSDTTITLTVPLSASTTYYWRVSASISSLASAYSVVDSFTTGTGIDAVVEGKGLPKEFALSNNYPNPFNPSTTIKATLDRSGVMSLIIYNVLGQAVKVVDRGYKTTGVYTYEIDLNDFASGVYFYRLQQNTNVITKKLLLLK